MKRFLGSLIVALLAIPTMTFAVPVIDGAADVEYGSAIVTQQLATTAQDSTLGLKGASNGSELDAAYGFISNGVLYLVLAGNIDSGSNSPPAVAFDKLQIFFQTGPGGQNVITNVNTVGGADFGRLNNMKGLTFDAGFAPNYWMDVTIGGVGTNPTFYANFARMWSSPTNTGLGTFLGQSNPPNYVPLTNTTVAGASPASPFIAAINNSNTVGVAGDSAGCQSNGAPFSPGAVWTGVELAIPVAAIGASTGNVYICAFFTEDQFTNTYNQVLPPITGDTSYCQASLGATTNINFTTLPGQQYFVIVPPPCTFGLNPISANYGLSGGTGTVSVVVAGPCPWSVTSNVPWVTITSATNGSGPATISYSVGTNATTVGRQGILTLLNPPSQPLTFAVNQFGSPLGPIPVDGIAEAGYGSSIVTQQIGTGFGDNCSNDLEVTACGGSELDAGYGTISNGILYLVLAGNLENNFNKLELFFETAAGGQNTLTNINPDVDFNGLNRMGAGGGSVSNGNPGLTFDADFAANYFVSVACGGNPYAVYANYAQLYPGGGGTNGYFLGQTAALTNGTLFGGTNPYGIQATINNSNFLGVDGTSCYNDPSFVFQGSVATGVEIGIPLAALGNPTGPIKVCAFVNSGGNDFMSNQILGPLFDGTDFITCPTNFGDPTLVNLSSQPGTNYFVVANPQPFLPAITSVSISNTDVRVSWTTQSGSVYQLQRASALTTNTTWSALGSTTNGTGAIITQVDSGAGTNTPGLYYRVQQTP